MKGHKKRKRDKVQYDKEENGEEEYVEKSVPGEGGAEEEEDEENINEKKRRAEEIAMNFPAFQLSLLMTRKTPTNLGLFSFLKRLL